MAYGDGTLNLSGNLNVAIGRPLDARYILDNEADLTAAASWTAGGANYAYDGMMVYCKDTNKTWQLQGSNDYSASANWHEVGSGGGGGSGGGDGNPVGTLIWFAGSTPPAGYLLCNGDVVSRATYSSLFEVIGTTYGAGDESTTFNLPNLIDRFVEGSTTAGTVKAAGLPDITGTIGLGDASVLVAEGLNTGAFGATPDAYRLYVLGTQYTQPITTFAASKSNSIYGNSVTVQPSALTALPCIKY